MSKKVLLIVVFILVLAGGGIMYLLASSSDKTAKENMMGRTADSQAPNNSTAESSPPATATPGRYIDYSQTAISDTPGTKLLFFHAPWCPQCRSLETSIKQSGVPEGVTIIKVDYDSNQELRKKYGVTLQTTVVKIDDQGNFVKKFVAYDEPSVDGVRRNLL